MTLLQKLVKHKGHEGTQRKISSFSTVVYFVSFVVKGLFAVDSNIQIILKFAINQLKHLISRKVPFV